MRQVTYNPTTEIVTIQPSHDWQQVETVSYTQFKARAFVVEHLSANGKLASILNSQQLYTAYMLCDGFGKIDNAQYQEIGWDWSHVRDSSNDAFILVAQYIATETWGKSFEALVQQDKAHQAQLKEHGVDLELPEMVISFKEHFEMV